VEKENHEIWREGVDIKKYPITVLPKETEVLIVGGGMAGITNAYLLSKIGKKVILLEKETLGGHVTSRTTGFLTPVIDTDPLKLIKQFGFENAKLILESHRNAVDEVEKIINTEKIECEFERCTNFIYANSESEEKYLIKLAEGYKKLGISAEFKKDNNLKFSKFGYIEMPNHAKFHAIKYLTELAKIAVKNGVIIAENTEVLNLNDKKDFVEVEIENTEVIKAKKVISATYVPFGQNKKISHLANLYREYVIEYKVHHGELLNGTYEDTLDPYNYFRIDNKGGFDRLIIGGADHLDVMKVDPNINFDSMIKYSQKLFGSVKLEEVRHWSGLMLETNDGLAFIGDYNHGNIFYIFGFSGNGMTYSYIAGKIFLDKILSVENPYSEVYRVIRKVSWLKRLFYIK